MTSIEFKELNKQNTNVDVGTAYILSVVELEKFTLQVDMAISPNVLGEFH